MGKFRQCLTELSARNMVMAALAGYYSVTVLLGSKVICTFVLWNL